MAGAAGSTGKMSASTWQYWTVLPLMTLVLTEVDVTRPPCVGRLMTDAGIVIWSSAAQSGAAVEEYDPAGVVAVAEAAPRIWGAPADRIMVASRTSRRVPTPFAEVVIQAAFVDSAGRYGGHIKALLLSR